jgi:GTP cyclohydrolase II
MNAAHSPANSALFGNEEHLSVSRALGELQARRPIRVNAPGEVLFALPVEGLDNQRLHEFVALCGPNAPELIVTQQRARAIGIEASTPMALSLAGEPRTISSPSLPMLNARVVLKASASEKS